MRACLPILVLALLAWPPRASAEEPGQPEPLLVVMPIFGTSPPEMELPWAEHLAESLLLALPVNSLRVTAQEPTGPVLPGTVEPVARQRGDELGAAAVMWGELIPAGPCSAPRMIRLRILDLGTETLYTRELCPEQAGRDDISRAMALAAVTALRSGEVGELRIPEAKRHPKPRISRAPRCPKCRACAPCPDCPPCPVAATARPHPSQGRLFVRLGPQATSHPRWSSAGYGVEAGLLWAPLTWLEIGVGMQALRGRSFRAEDVQALYTSWPVLVWLGFWWQDGELELGLTLGGQVAWTRLDVLLERLETATSVERVNPVVYARAGLRYWTPWGFGLQLQAGPAVFLRRQQYTYGTTLGNETVLHMQTVSLEAGLHLIVPMF